MAMSNFVSFFAKDKVDGIENYFSTLQQKFPRHHIFHRLSSKRKRTLVKEQCAMICIKELMPHCIQVQFRELKLIDILLNCFGILFMLT